MMRVKCPKCGKDYPDKAGHICAGDEPPPGNDNAPDKVIPFNAKEWRRNYMRHYMRRLRQRLKEAQK
jgi:hypothetical protein